MNVKHKKRSLWVACRLLLMLAALPVAAALLAQGQPAIRNYPPDEYGAHNQNWAIVQDARGVMYFGNSHGVLEYDGVFWRLIPVQEARIARSLALGPGQRVYVGGHGEMGYLEPGSAGQLRFVSLLPQIEERYRDFTNVWKTLATPEGIVFTTDKYLFRWDGQNMRVWTAETAFLGGFWLNGRCYIRQREAGLMQLTGDSLRLAPGGKPLADENISAMLAYERAGIESTLIVTRANGLFLYDGDIYTRFATEVDELLKRTQAYSATRLSNGQYALGTLQEGIVIIDAAGRLRQRLHKAAGFQDDAVLSLFEDRQGGLWAGLQVGIARAETASPYRYFGPSQGLEGSVWEMHRHDNRLWVATIMGLYYLNDSEEFRRMADVPSECWALTAVGASLLVATFNGVYEVSGNQARRITTDFTFSLHRSLQDPQRVFAGLSSGVRSLYIEGGRWRDEGKWEGIDEEIRHFYETPDGQLWLTDYHQGLLLADFSAGYPLRPSLMRFDTLHGLPPANRVVVFPTDQGLRFATMQGIFQFDAATKRFYPDSALVQGLPHPAIELFSASPDRQGSLWLLADDNAQSGVARRQSEGRYEWDQSPFWRIAERPVFSVYPDPELVQVTWIGGTDLVMRYDGAVDSRYGPGFQTLIREVVANGDSILFGGAEGAQPLALKLAYAYNSLRIRYAAPSFDDEAKNQYQYFLEGYDDDWSPWSAETYKDYTRLPPGRYRFLVRARNIYGQIGETGAFDLHILPPFYRTWWAYLLYALLLAGLAWQFWRYALKRIQSRHQRELEQVEYNKLKELDELKSRFFADISHEFRTPLTLILGPIEKLLAEQPKEEHARQLLLVKRNAQRLLNLINQLLDLSKLEAGKLQLERSQADIIPLLRGLVYSFESLAESKKIALHFSSALPSAFLDFDRDKMEQIVANLISNAIKFTPTGGAVHLEVIAAAEGRQIQIEVRDTGPGIPAEHLPRVFERFHQAAEAAPGGELGSGIGLALVKELTELHGGNISASNAAGGGARFRLFLPYSAEASEPPASPANKGRLLKDPVVVESASQVELEPSLPQMADADAATLLLVEDNADMRAFIRDTLADKYQVIEAADGQEGIEMALEHIPDLIISDVMMPRVDGLELCGALKNDERSSHIPIVLLTAKADIESRLAGLERGADDYLAKPFNRDELLIRTRNLLENRRRLRERYASLQPPEPSDDQDVQIEDAFLQKIRRIVEEHLSDSEFEIDQLARMLGMSRSQLFRKVKALTGQSPSIFIRNVRLQRGRELLLTTEMNVSEVAYEVGFSKPGYFSDAFMEAYGVRPSQVRK
jgi:signal transduction histidine kinase/DNA-binding response OmpR family regulator/ligand-binding sensor domain-containing protein